MVRGQISLLPPSTHAGTVAQLAPRFPDAYCLAETRAADIDLPQIARRCRRRCRRRRGSTNVDAAASDEQTVAYVFTSGSTGAPTLHRKRWGSLVVNVRAEAERLGCGDGAPSHAIVATVPPQHMYGFESSLLMAWQSGACDRRRASVLSGRHRRGARATAGAADARDDAVPSARADRRRRARCRRSPGSSAATAPLSHALAADGRAALRRAGRGDLRLHRDRPARVAATDGRSPLARCSATCRDRIVVDGQATASGGHIEQPTPLGDLIELGARLRDVAPLLARRPLGGPRQHRRQADVARPSQPAAATRSTASSTASSSRPTTTSARRRRAARGVVVAPTLDAARLLAALRDAHRRGLPAEADPLRRPHAAQRHRQADAGARCSDSSSSIGARPRCARDADGAPRRDDQPAAADRGGPSGVRRSLPGAADRARRRAARRGLRAIGRRSRARRGPTALPHRRREVPVDGRPGRTGPRSRSRRRDDGLSVPAAGLRRTRRTTSGSR